MSRGWWRRRSEQDLDDELRAHLEMATGDYMARGMSEADARAAAQREFGNVPLIKQTTREMWSLERQMSGGSGHVH